jgi:exopolyphosphatase/guanosine-5'-triphosphate,3'-diphosphate pyrophosphatase
MRVAALDIGSNSVRLLVAEERSGVAASVASFGATTRLAEGFGDKGAFTSRAVARTAGAAQQMVREAHRLDVVRVRAVATGVLRRARHGNAVVGLIEEAAGVRVEILSGAEEGRLCLLGAWSVLGPDPEQVRLIDVGGGSTELIEGTPWKVRRALSLQLGSVLINERYLRSDPPDPGDVAAARAEAGRLLADNGLAPKAGDVVATGGTATSLASLELALQRYSPDRVHGCRLDRERLTSVTGRLASMTIAQRKQLVGLPRDRADIILGGAVILLAAVESWGADGCVVSDRGLRHGVVMELLGLGCWRGAGEPGTEGADSGQ